MNTTPELQAAFISATVALARNEILNGADPTDAAAEILAALRQKFEQGDPSESVCDSPRHWLAEFCRPLAGDLVEQAR